MSDRIVRVTAAAGVLLAVMLVPLSLQAASADSNAAPAVCRSGSVSILVGGAGADAPGAACSGFGRQAGPRSSTTGAGLSGAVRRETVATGGADQERRAILESELQHEMALLKQSERGNTDESRLAAARSRANIEALRREMSR